MADDQHPDTHPHGHSHEAGHSPEHHQAGAGPEPEALPPALDLSIPDSELSPGQLGRRGFLHRAGLLGAAAAGAGVLATGPGAGSAAADSEDDREHAPRGQGHRPVEFPLVAVGVLCLERRRREQHG